MEPRAGLELEVKKHLKKVKFLFYLKLIAIRVISPEISDLSRMRANRGFDGVGWVG